MRTIAAMLVTAAVVTSCGEGGTDVHCDLSSGNQLVDERCIEALFADSQVRLPQPSGYAKPSFEVRSTNPTSIDAQYPPLDPEKTPLLTFGAQEQPGERTACVVVAVDSTCETRVVHGVEVELNHGPDNASAQWVDSAISYSLELAKVAEPSLLPMVLAIVEDMVSE